MKYFNYKIILSAIFILALSFLNAQKIVHLEGSYDLDGDNLLEHSDQIYGAEIFFKFNLSLLADNISVIELDNLSQRKLEGEITLHEMTSA